MLVLHGSRLQPSGANVAGFAIWGEVSPTRQKAARARGKAAGASARPRAHPFGATADQLRDAVAQIYPECDPRALEPRTIIARLPTASAVPLPSPELGADVALADERPVLAAWKIEALRLDAAHISRALTSPDDQAAPNEVVLGDDLRFWTVVARFALELLYRQRFVPTLRKEGDAYVARWRPVLDRSEASASGANGLEDDWQRTIALASSMPPSCRALAWDAASPEPRPGHLLNEYLEEVVDGLARQTQPFGDGRPTRRRPPAEAWLEALQGDATVDADPKKLSTFFDQHRAWAEPALSATGADAFRVCFRLDPPPTDEATAATVAPKAAAREWTLHYMLQATDDPSLLVPAATVWRQRGATARFLNRKFDNPHERLLAGLGTASRLLPPIESSLRSARPELCHLTVAEAHDLVREKAVLLKSSGFGVLVPGLDAKLSVRVRLGRKSPKDKGLGLLGWQSIVEYDWELALGGEPLSREEFEALAKLKEPLVQVRGRWIELRPDQIEQALAFFEKNANGGQMSLQEAIKLAIAPDGSHGLPIVEVTAEGWIDDLLQKLRGGERRETVDEPTGFIGQLRGYQKVGVAWLTALRRHGLGACLADDMGLGKTIQIIATLLHQRQREQDVPPAPVLLVCPTSVVGNWRHELARFAPSLRVLVHHGAARNKEEFADEAARHDIVISTYALLHRDETELTGVEWGSVVLDEAQNIKNASTKAAQAARKLRARWRAALTGTPVENRLAELWSILQFLNPGYLGSSEEFSKRFAHPIERAHDSTTTKRLKALVSPFILRRVKSDRTIIQDLPEKNEMKVYCSLTKEQVTLYEAIVHESLRQIEEAEAMKRRGLVLATLTKLKQVCNHPALFLHDRSQLDGRSGKLARLGEMLEEVAAVGDHALVFTQYAEMGKMLREHLQMRFGREVLFLHGGTPVAERDRMVARFQGEGKGSHLFVLSIKAGGTGLNLTRANHVFHYDRWWNPAVENQATDRAYRIGQQRNVQVHKFICSGTFEEAIDQLIERKTEISAAVVGTNEAWITELSTDELRNLFALRRDAVVEV